MTAAIIGGVLIGLAAAAMWIGSGRITGISGLISELLRPRPDETAWRVAFLAGLVVAGAGAALVAPSAIGTPPGTWMQLALAGLLVGMGTRIGNGCTSGHGVCGIPRASARSWVATLTFIATGMVTVWWMGGVA